MPILGERPPSDGGKFGSIRPGLVKKTNKFISFLLKNIEIFIVLVLIFIGSNFHVLFPNIGEGNLMDIYLAGQQLFGASFLFVGLYFFRINRKEVFKKSFYLGIFALSILCTIGEFFTVFGNTFLSQIDKGLFLFSEYAFIAGIMTLGFIFFNKNGK